MNDHDDRAITDCPPHEPPEQVSEAMVELAYRRGFCQGAAAALYALQAGFMQADIDAWVHDRLVPWRRKALKFRAGKEPEIEFPEWLHLYCPDRNAAELRKDGK